MERRRFCAGVLGVMAGASLLKVWADGKPSAAPSPQPINPSDKGKVKVKIENFDTSGKSLGVEEVVPVVKTDEEWKKLLSPLAFEVLRKEGTERAFTSELLKNKSNGLYRCAGCDTALFETRTKFDSGTGWPSFWAPLSKHNVEEWVDRSLGMVRTAVVCRRCKGHLGHVFDDGPKPTGLRYCLNGVALHFVPFT